MNNQFYDLIVVGGGPAGLATAATAKSEGINTLLLDCSNTLGGQAGTSTMIKNYLGFPCGVTGADLADRMRRQAEEFGVDILLPLRVNGIHRDDGGFLAVEDDGAGSFRAKAVALTFGVQYRRLQVMNASKFVGKGIVYGSPSVDDTYTNQNLVVIGGANSAGQAALYLAKCENCTVHILVRGNTLAARMSDYLVQDIDNMPNIHVHLNAEMHDVKGNQSHKLAAIEIRQNDAISTMKVDKIFVMIGAEPKTNWVSKAGVRLDRGFIVTGRHLDEDSLATFVDACGRTPHEHETSMPGVFAAGDLVAHTPKRVATAVGAGAALVQDLHEYYADLRTR